MKKYVTAIIYLVVIFAGIIFFTSPNLNPLYSEGLAFWSFFLTVLMAILMVLSAGAKNIVYLKNGAVHAPFPKKGRVFLLIAAIPWGILILVSIYSSVLFHVGQYQSQLTEPEIRQFSADVQPIDINQLPVVDKELASLLADKKLGEKPALGSQVTLGTPTIQKVNGKLVWAVPLLHSGFFKWISSEDGAPGYILVSATNPRDVSYVENFKIKYQQNGYFLDNLDRYARFSSGFFKGLTDYSFEINDDGQPYWVVSTYKNLVGFSLPESDGVLIINASTGEATRYALGNVPGWVDRVQPEDFIMNQINNRGNYVHGLFNFSNKDKFQTSQKSAIVYNNNRCYLFTGLTSVGADESTNGFMLVDMVTKTPYLYQVSGATESAAEKSAEGKVQNLHYTASFPLITNVDGQPAYFMTLKDDARLVKQYAFVSVTDYTSVGNGENIADAITSFRSVLKNTGGSSAIDTTGQQETVTGKVDRIASEISGGNTVYYVILQEQPDKIFMAVADLSRELALTRTGDNVSLTYVKTTKTIIDLAVFDNLMYTQK